MNTEKNAEDRAQFVADLRVLADLIEREASLPLPYCMEGTGYPSLTIRDKEGQLTAVFAAAQLLGTEVVYDRIGGTVQTRMKTGLVKYGLYVSIDKQGQPNDVVTVSSPSQILRNTAAVSS